MLNTDINGETKRLQEEQKDALKQQSVLDTAHQQAITSQENFLQKFFDLIGKAAQDNLKNMETQVGGVFSALGTTIHNALTNAASNWLGQGPGVSLPGHASGILNNPVGHFATVGEQGPETMFVPQGASILPNGMSPSIGGGGTGGSNQPVIFQLDGVQFARVVMPYLANAIRMNVGSVGY